MYKYIKTIDKKNCEKIQRYILKHFEEEGIKQLREELKQRMNDITEYNNESEYKEMVRVIMSGSFSKRDDDIKTFLDGLGLKNTENNGSMDDLSMYVDLIAREVLKMLEK